MRSNDQDRRPERPIYRPPSDGPLDVVERALVTALAQAMLKQLRATYGEDLELADVNDPGETVT